MTLIKRIALMSLVAALVICFACPMGMAENVIIINAPVEGGAIDGAKVITQYEIRNSSSAELELTHAATMRLDDIITFELVSTTVGEDNDTTAIVSDDRVVKLTFNRETSIFTAKALKAGECKVEFRNVLDSGKYGNTRLVLTFTVFHDPTESITLNYEQLTIKQGKTQTLKATVLPKTADQKVVWTTDNANIAKVGKKGVVKGVGSGQTTITCTTSDGVQASCVVTVIPKKPDPESIVLEPAVLNLLKGKKKKLAPVIQPAGANRKVVWTSSDSTTAKVTSAGVVKAVNPGTATITCTTKQAGLTATCEVVVVTRYADPESITLNSESITVAKGQKQKLIPTVLPADANQNVTWSSSKKGVAKVNSNGVVTGVKAGTAVITCKTKQGGLIATCEVTVMPKN